MILPDHEIIRLKPCSPFDESYVTPCGLDFCVTNFRSPDGDDIRCHRTGSSGYRIAIPPHSFVLCDSVVEWNIPSDITATILARSRVQRLGIIGVQGRMHPGWKGVLLIEFYNASNGFVLIDPLEPFANATFEKLFNRAAKPYAGRYQNQQQGSE